MKSAIYNCFSESISVFQELPLLLQGCTLAGYSALIQAHLTFALKYEGLNLHVLHALFSAIKPDEITRIVQSEPTGSYSRRIWFLYEWLTGSKLPLDDVATGNFVELINSKLQYPWPARDSKRHRVRNNLPGNAS